MPSQEVTFSKSLTAAKAEDIKEFQCDAAGLLLVVRLRTTVAGVQREVHPCCTSRVTGANEQGYRSQRSEQMHLPDDGCIEHGYTRPQKEENPITRWGALSHEDLCHQFMRALEEQSSETDRRELVRAEGGGWRAF